MPTLVLTGERDTPGNRVASGTLVKAIPGARLVVIPGADHAIRIGWAKELNEALIAFLGSRQRARLCRRAARLDVAPADDELKRTLSVPDRRNAA